jgi:DNA-directed RNA polymerase specialized sigma subunit
VRWAIGNVPLHLREDAEQAVRIALWRCSGRFDAGRGVRFSTFALEWMRCAALKFLAAEDPLTPWERRKVRKGLRADVVRVDASVAWYLRDPAPSPYTLAVRARAYRFLALARPDEQRAILGWMEERPDSETGAEMGVSAGRVSDLRKMGLHRIRAMVRRGVRPPAIGREGHGGRNGV